jgi:(p)ppGpp synthase/HD superfamily hydrolase
VNLQTRAYLFAAAAHASVNQVRKYTGEPYIAHPVEVVCILASESSRQPTPEMIAAAFLHDVVEDTPITIEQVRAEFGIYVADLVSDLTDVTKPEDGNRATRKAIELERIAKTSPQAKTIKLADLISNTRSIAEHDPKFAKVYLPEKMALLDVLHEGDRRLWQVAMEQITNLIFAMAAAA